MYELSKSSFGTFEQYCLSSSTSKQSITFVPSRGACLLSLIFNGTNVLDGYKSGEELDANTWGKSGLLYPFPNRLKNGQFTWKDENYQFPINDVATGNALHGFGMERPLIITEERLNGDHAMVSMEGYYDGSLPYYPWPFTVGVSYILSDKNGFEVEFSVKNEAKEDIPFGIGWHPYFSLNDQISEHTLQLPALAQVEIDQFMIPTGNKQVFDLFSEEKQIAKHVFDHCFVPLESKNSLSVQLKVADNQLEYWQETGEGKFNFIQIFTPPYGSSIALEPMSCNVNGLNNGDGLIALKPGEKFSARAGVRFS